MYSLSPEIRMEHTIDIHCKCGAYLGKVVPGYTQAIQCFCGEVVPVSKPKTEELVRRDYAVAVPA